MTNFHGIASEIAIISGYSKAFFTEITLSIVFFSEMTQVKQF